MTTYTSHKVKLRTFIVKCIAIETLYIQSKSNCKHVKYDLKTIKTNTHKYILKFGKQSFCKKYFEIKHPKPYILVLEMNLSYQVKVFMCNTLSGYSFKVAQFKNQQDLKFANIVGYLYQNHLCISLVLVVRPYYLLDQD